MRSKYFIKTTLIAIGLFFMAQAFTGCSADAIDNSVKSSLEIRTVIGELNETLTTTKTAWSNADKSMLQKETIADINFALNKASEFYNSYANYKPGKTLTLGSLYSKARLSAEAAISGLMADNATPDMKERAGKITILLDKLNSQESDLIDGVLDSMDTRVRKLTEVLIAIVKVLK